jgi:hypothetical protein
MSGHLRADCAHACLTCVSTNTGRLAPSQNRTVCPARRLSGGDAMIAPAAAAPAEIRITLAAVRAADLVMIYGRRRFGFSDSFALPRMLSELLPYVELLPYDEPAP